MRHRQICILAAIILIGLAALTGCGTSTNPGAPAPEPGLDVYSSLSGTSYVGLTTIGTIPLDPEIDAFMEDCARGVSEWRAGAFSYPRRLAADMGESFSYVAAVDIRENPLPADKTISGTEEAEEPETPEEAAELETPQEAALEEELEAEPEVEPIAVQCVLGAELIPVGESLEVDNPGWVLREFTPTGIVNWSWSVKAIAPNGHDLRLDLRPAVALHDGGEVLALGDSALQTTTFLTHVQINSTWLVRLDQWWKNNWGIIVSVAGGLGMAVVALIKWGGSLAQALHDARTISRGKGKED